MNILSKWLRSYVPGITVDDRQLADDLTLRGIAVEGIHDLGPGNGHLFEMDITTNRVDAMNHYGIAREAATIYNLPLAPLDTALPAALPAAKPFSVQIAPDAQSLCGRFTAQVLRNVTIAPLHRPVSPSTSRCWDRSPSPTRSMPPTSFCKGWAIPPTRSTWTRSTAESSSASRARARGSSCSMDRTHAGSQRSCRRRPRQAAGPGRRYGRLGLHDYRRHQKHFDRGRVVRPRQHPAQLATPRSAHRRIAPLRARRGLQRLPGCQRAGRKTHPAIRWRARGRTGRRRRPSHRRAHRQSPAHRALARPGAAPPWHNARRPAQPIRAHRRAGPPGPHRSRLHPHRSRDQRSSTCN